MARSTSPRATLLLFLLFFFGFVVVTLAFIDLQWTHLVFEPETKSRRGVTSSGLSRTAAAVLS